MTPKDSPPPPCSHQPCLLYALLPRLQAIPNAPVPQAVVARAAAPTISLDIPHSHNPLDTYRAVHIPPAQPHQLPAHRRPHPQRRPRALPQRRHSPRPREQPRPRHRTLQHPHRQGRRPAHPGRRRLPRRQHRRRPEHPRRRRRRLRLSLLGRRSRRHLGRRRRSGRRRRRPRPVHPRLRLRRLLLRPPHHRHHRLPELRHPPRQRRPRRRPHPPAGSLLGQLQLRPGLRHRHQHQHRLRRRPRHHQLSQLAPAPRARQLLPGRAPPAPPLRLRLRPQPPLPAHRAQQPAHLRPRLRAPGRHHRHANRKHLLGPRSRLRRRAGQAALARLQPTRHSRHRPQGAGPPGHPRPRRHQG